MLSGLALGGCLASVFYSHIISAIFLPSSVNDNVVRGFHSLAYMAAVFNGIVTYMSLVLTDPERRVRMRVKMRLLALAQFCLIAAFGYFFVLCFISVCHLKVSG